MKILLVLVFLIGSTAFAAAAPSSDKAPTCADFLNAEVISLNDIFLYHGLESFEEGQFKIIEIQAKDDADRKAKISALRNILKDAGIDYSRDKETDTLFIQTFSSMEVMKLYSTLRPFETLLQTLKIIDRGEEVLVDTNYAPLEGAAKQMDSVRSRTLTQEQRRKVIRKNLAKNYGNKYSQSEYDELTLAMADGLYKSVRTEDVVFLFDEILKNRAFILNAKLENVTGQPLTVDGTAYILTLDNGSRVFIKIDETQKEFSLFSVLVSPDASLGTFYSFINDKMAQNFTNYPADFYNVHGHFKESKIYGEPGPAEHSLEVYANQVNAQGKRGLQNAFQMQIQLDEQKVPQSLVVQANDNFGGYDMLSMKVQAAGKVVKVERLTH